MTQRFLEVADITSAFVPVDMQTAANSGDWVNLKSYDRVLAVLFKAIGTAGDDPIFKLQQATDNTGAGAKDLTFTTIWKKVGTLTGIAAWTKITQAAATSYVDTDSAEAQTIMAVEIRSEDLDAANNFTHVQLSVADVGGNAQLGCGFYIMLNPIRQGATLPSAEA